MKLRGLYVITSAELAVRDSLTTQVRTALEAGAAAIQYRDKSADTARRRDEALALRDMCAGFAVPLIVNDDAALAAEIGAAGVHLGRDDADIARAREVLGPKAIIGVSCYNEFARAVAAQRAGADYVAFGSFFPSPTKPQAVRADAELLRRGRRELALPLVAIGGITPENGRQLVEAGADMLAVIHGVFGQPDVSAACRRYVKLFEPEDPYP